MKKINTVKNMIVFMVMIIMTLSLTACGSKHEAVKPDKDPKKIVQDKNYTEDLKKEKEVVAGQVYVQNNMAIATMIIKDNVSEKDAKALADNYAKELKKTYKNMTINVQAVQKGKNIANIVINKDN